MFERQQVQTEVAAQLHSLIGDAGDEVVELLFTNAFDAYGARSGIIASLIGFGILFFRRLGGSQRTQGVARRHLERA